MPTAGSSSQAAVEFAINLLSELPVLLNAGMDVLEVVNRGREQLAVMKAENRGPTDAEWAELNGRIANLRGQLQAPVSRGDASPT